MYKVSTVYEKPQSIIGIIKEKAVKEINPTKIEVRARGTIAVPAIKTSIEK